MTTFITEIYYQIFARERRHVFDWYTYIYIFTPNWRLQHRRQKKAVFREALEPRLMMIMISPPHQHPPPPPPRARESATWYNLIVNLINFLRDKTDLCWVRGGGRRWWGRRRRRSWWRRWRRRQLLLASKQQSINHETGGGNGGREGRRKGWGGGGGEIRPTWNLVHLYGVLCVCGMKAVLHQKMISRSFQ